MLLESKASYHQLFKIDPISVALRYKLSSKLQSILKHAECLQLLFYLLIVATYLPTYLKWSFFVQSRPVILRAMVSGEQSFQKQSLVTDGTAYWGMILRLHLSQLLYFLPPWSNLNHIGKLALGRDNSSQQWKRSHTFRPKSVVNPVKHFTLINYDSRVVI